MGKRGPGAGRLRSAAAGAPPVPASHAGTLFEAFDPPTPVAAAHPWEQDGMQPDDRGGRIERLEKRAGV